MTDQGRPLSRRARREAEARAAAPDQPTTPIPRADPSTFTNPDGTPLSRRQRREIERQDSPPETWTAEEEMLATGQLPTMTPDLLDEQEMVERRRAEEREEQGFVEPSEPEQMVDRARSMFAAAPAPEAEPSAEPVVEAEPVHEPEPEAFVAAEPVVEAAPVHEAEPVVEPEPEPVVEAEPTPEPESFVEPEPEAVVEPEQPVAEAPAEPAPATDGIPEQYRHLFPPGSLQARRLQERLERGESITPPSGTPAPVASTGEDPAEEIRRLTAAAMAGITRAQQVRRPEVPTEPEPAAQAEEQQTPAQEPEASVAPDPEVASAPEAVSAPEAEPEASSEPEPEPEAAIEPAPEAVAEPAPSTGSFFAPVLPPEGTEEPLESGAPYAPPMPARADEIDPTTALPQRGGVPVSELPTEAMPPVDAPVAAPAPEPESAPRSQPQAPAAPPALRPAGMPSSGEVPTAAASAPSVWANHPLAVAQPREVADYAPSQDIPIPDFTKIMHGYASTTSSAGAPPVGQVGDEPTGTDIPALTGGIEVPRRPLPEEHDEHGHGFGWQHLAVIAAAAFLLGVLVWNLTGNA